MEIWQLVSGFVGGLSLASIGAALTRLPRTPTRPLIHAFVLSGVLWAAGDVIATDARDMGWKLTGIAILYSGSIFLPALWWAIVLRWSEEVGAALPFRAPAWAWVPLAWAAVMWVAMLTNPWHGEFLLPVVGGLNVYQPLWYAMAVPSYALILAALAVELAVSRRVPRPSVQRQALVLVAASGVTLVGNLLYVTRIVPQNLTIIVLSISGALLVVGMAREGLFGVLSAALPAIADDHPDGLVVVGDDGHVSYLNERAEKLLAPLHIRTDLELLTTLQHSSLRPESRTPWEPLDDTGWWRALTSEEGVLLRQDGESARWLHLSASAVARRGANAGGYFLRISDVTAAKQAERHARQTRRLESVASVARSVSREFQNTLAVVEGNALLLAEDCRGDDASARKIGRIIDSARQAVDLAHQLQLFTGSVDTVRTPLELAEVVTEMCGLVESDLRPGTSMTILPGRQLLPVEADPIQIRQAIYDLLINAIEAMADDGGRIVVRTGARYVDPARVEDLLWGSDRPMGDFAFVSVEDEGGGMDSDTAERAFEPYFSTRSKDRGHGLPTVLGIVRAHDGLVALENAMGRGCTFTLYFPSTPA